MISAPKEHNKSIKASHTIKWCDWLFLLCNSTNARRLAHIRTFFYFELYKGLNYGFKNVKNFFIKKLGESRNISYLCGMNYN